LNIVFEQIESVVLAAIRLAACEAKAAGLMAAGNGVSRSTPAKYYHYNEARNTAELADKRNIRYGTAGCDYGC